VSSEIPQSDGDALDEASPRAFTRRRLLQSAAAAGLVAVSGNLLACGGDDGEEAAAPTGAAKTTGATTAETAAQRGGRFRVAMLGGGDSETTDPFIAGNNEIDVARAAITYERLLTLDLEGAPTRQLLEDLSPSSDLRTWKLKVASDRVFHDGAPFTANDVVYSLRWILDPANKAQGNAAISFIDPNNIRALDQTTVEIALDEPFAMLDTILSDRGLWMIKEGTTSFDTPNGTGPFKFESFARGERSVHVRNDDYPKHDGPYLDAVELISFSDETAALNALNGGQVDATNDIGPRVVSIVEQNPDLRVLRAEGTNWVPLTMSVDAEPFTDPRIRQAFRLMTNREEMVQNVQLGEGSVANDLFSPADPDYAGAEFPQREYDPEQAGALLKEAGKEGLTVSLYTGEAGAGMVESATLFVNQAKAAGVTVKLDKVPGDQYWSLKYLKAPFAQSWWAGRPLITQITSALPPAGADCCNETHWYREDFHKLFNDALRTGDETKRHDMFIELQRMLWEEGGYIIWGFNNVLDAYSRNVQGLKASRVRWLGFYDFTDVSMT